MHEIFISYSSRHRELTQQIAATLETQYGPGSVWWDHELEARGPYNAQIRAVLDAARVVVVLWTQDATVSDYVYAEAVRAHEQHKLVNVRPSETSFRQIPEPLNIHHVEEAGDTARILRSVAGVMQGRPLPTRVPLHEIYWRQHGERIVDARQECLGPVVQRIRPTQLLQAKYEVVPYRDATGCLEELMLWSRQAERPVAGTLLCGAGGLGKTRLAIELAARLRREAEWMAGFVALPKNPTESKVRQYWQGLEQLIAEGEEPGLLLVLDYAEGRQTELKELALRLRAQGLVARRQIRVLLLSRNAGEWWTDLHDADTALQSIFDDDEGTAHVIALPPIAGAAARLSLFRDCLTAFGRILEGQGKDLSSYSIPNELTTMVAEGTAGTEPLAVQMATLVWLGGAGFPSLKGGVPTLLDRVLQLEYEHWTRIVGALDNIARSALQRAAAQITLLHGLASSEAAEQILMRDTYYAGRRNARADVAPLLWQLRSLLGGPDGTLGPLEPDLVGEHLVAKRGDKDLLEACLAWIAETLDPATAAEKRRSLVTVLQRATRAEHGESTHRQARTLLRHLITGHLPELASAIVSTTIQTPGALVEVLLSELAHLDEAALELLDTEVPHESTTLADVSLGLAQRQLDLSRRRVAALKWPPLSDQETLKLFLAVGLAARIAPIVTSEDKSPPAEFEPTLQRFAMLLRVVAARLHANGVTDVAVNNVELAVVVLHYLSQRSERSGLELALATSTALLDHSAYLATLGRHDQAITEMESAIKNFRMIAEWAPTSYVAELIRGLLNLTASLSRAGNQQRALTIAEESEVLARRLATQHPDDHLLSLAMALHNLSNVHSARGSPDRALHTSAESVDICRSLSAADPDRYLKYLADGLTIYGACLADVGQHEAALGAEAEAIEVFRTLSKSHPVAFRVRLARALHNLSGSLCEMGRLDEAVAAVDEAIAIFEGKHAPHTPAIRRELAGSLQRKAFLLRKATRLTDAVSALEQEIRVRRDLLGVEQSEDDLKLLAQRLAVIAHDLSALDRRADALGALRESADITRQCALRNPALLPVLAEVLSQCATWYFEAGERAEALGAISETANVHRTLAETEPGTYLPELATSLNNMSIAQLGLGDFEHALASIKESTDIFRRLADGNPEVFTTRYAMGLSRLSQHLIDAGQQEDAMAYSEQAISLLRKLAGEAPEAYLGDLAASLDHHSTVLSSRGQREAAQAFALEALAAYRSLCRDVGDAYLPDLTLCLRKVSTGFSALGRHLEAIPTIAEAIGVCETLADAEPARHTEDLARVYGDKSTICAAAGEFEEAARAAEWGLIRLWPLLERYPKAVGSLAMGLAGQHYQNCESAAIPFNQDLLARAANVLGLSDDSHAAGG
jgi:tetratricopeptide (TPR) repeat protein